MKVQVIDDEDHEEILERGCAIDVAKASGLVCLRLPADASGPEGRRRRTSRVWTVPATTRAVMQLADQLVTARVEKVTLESTSDYWRIWYYLLEGAGLNVQLVNSGDASTHRAVPRPTSWTACGRPS